MKHQKEILPSEKALNEKRIDILLNEYQELNNWYRHNNIMAWTMGTILIPLSLGIFAYTIQNLSNRTIIDLILLTIASIGVLVIWVLMFERMSFYTKIRQGRIKYIEEVLGMENHLIFDRKTKAEKRKLSKIGSVVGIRLLNKILVILFTVVWIGVIVIKYLD